MRWCSAAGVSTEATPLALTLTAQWVSSVCGPVCIAEVRCGVTMEGRKFRAQSSSGHFMLTQLSSKRREITN
jgi:hypothetical protein